MSIVQVLIVAPTLTKGGMERQLSIFLNRYDRSKIKATLAILKADVQYEIPPDVDLIVFNKKYKLDVAFYYRLIRLLLSNKYDVINSKLSGINEMLMVLCGLLRRRSLVLEIQSAGAHVLSNYKKMKSIYNIFKMKWPVICNSRKAEQELHEYVPEGVPITLIRNGIETDRFKCMPELDTPHDPIILGFTGSIRPVKNVRLLIEAIGILNKKFGIHVVLEIVGHVRDQVYYETLISLEQALHVGEYVRWLGTRDDVEEFYNTIDICVLPSFHEGTPNVLLEAMSCECYCLISKAANSDNFLDKAFLFDENNAETLANKVLDYQRLSVEEKKKVGKNNRTYVETYYRMDKMVDTLTQVLTEASKR